MKPFFENFPVFKQRIPKNDLLDHRIVGRIQRINFKYILTEEEVRGELGFIPRCTLAPLNMNVHMPRFTFKPALNIFISDGLFLLEKIFNNAFPIGSIEAMFLFATHAPPRAIELVEYTVLFVEKRTLGQNVFTLQIGAHTRHARNKVLGAFATVDNLIPIPRSNRHIFHTRLALRPRKAIYAMLVFPCILAGKGANIIRNSERNQRFDLICLLQQEGIVLALVFDNRR